MRTTLVAILAALPIVAAPALAQQAAPSQNTPQNMQTEADKGIKTQNSGASGYVGDQDKPGAAAHAPGEPNRADNSNGVSTSPSAQNSGTGIAGAPGGKSGPPAKSGTVGAASQNPSAQSSDPANVKGLPGNKSGPPARK
ncbi:hypothetical protein JQ543_15375 [Bradyrhizobium diazoefficiens]|nr:hypothetical protein [Bradyrhizobium diazoefficiens]MBR0849131.1 hypothetical protein [Bradyrhizobium diazoefficiens]